MRLNGSKKGLDVKRFKLEEKEKKVNMAEAFFILMFCSY
jgi:hypothetical protein